MSGSYGAPPPPPAPAQPLPGPVRSPRGLVDVTVEPGMVVLRRHETWRDWFESELVLGLVGIAGLVVVVEAVRVTLAPR